METFHRDQDAGTDAKRGKSRLFDQFIRLWQADAHVCRQFLYAHCRLFHSDYSFLFRFFCLDPPTSQNQVVSPLAVRQPAFAPAKPSWHGVGAISVWVGFNFQGTKTQKGIVFIQIIRYNITENNFLMVKI